MTSGSNLYLRLLAAGTVWLLLASSVVALSLARRDVAPVAAPAAAPPDGGGRTSPPAGEEAGAHIPLPTHPDEAEELGAEGLVDAGLDTARGPWSDLAGPGWTPTERPVYVVEAEVVGRSRVDLDVVIAVRAARTQDRLTLRLLPVSEGLTAPRELDVRRDGLEADHVVDPAAATLTVQLQPPAEEDEAILVRVRSSYDVPDLGTLGADSGPLGHGLLAVGPSSTTLGHWLPLLTYEHAPPVEWGDIGSFPPAIWSVTVHGEGDVISGGHESSCPHDTTDCVWVRAVALRDVALVIYDEAATTSASATVGRARAVVPAAMAGVGDELLEVGSTAVAWMTDELGPLAWRSVTVAAVPLGGGAAGMEFPGIVLVSTDVLGSIDGGFGEVVTAHEVAHQWFHALVGSRSLAEPVVDEATAQYLTYTYWAHRYGQAAASRVAAAFFIDPYVAALDQGMEDGPALRPAAGFADGEAYGVLVYARAPLGFLAAERETGRATVLDLLERTVQRHGLDVLTAEGFLELADEIDPQVGNALRRWWTGSPGREAALELAR